MKNLAIVIALIGFSGLAFGQRRIIYQEQERDNTGGVLLANFNYGFHWPGGDFADRFGFGYSVGGSLELMEKHNFLIGADAFMYFGNRVNQDVLANLRNNDGIILGDNGALADVKLRMRAVQFGGHIGRIFRLFNNENNRSGIRVNVGAAFFQHKIKIQDDPVAVIAALDDEYKKGYDRLSNGLSLTQFVGYQNLSKSRLLNFMLGFELTQAFTKSRRSYNFDTRNTDTDSRIDLLAGFKIGWTLPLYIGEDAGEINY